MSGETASTGTEKLAEPVHIFISYKHHRDDKAILDELMDFMSADVARVGGKIWVDTALETGDDWDREIRAALAQTDIAIVLVSQRYLGSRYITEVEIKELIERRKHEGMVIMPLILSACLWQQHEWLAQTQFLPLAEQTIEEHFTEPGKRKRLFAQFTQELLKRIEQVKLKRQRDGRGAERRTGAFAPSSQVQYKRPMTVSEPSGQVQQKVRIAVSELRTGINTFRVISNSERGRVILSQILASRPIKYEQVKSEDIIPSHVFYVLEEGEQLNYRLLRAVVEEGVRVFLLLLVQESGLSLHSLDEKAELVGAEVLARTKIKLNDIHTLSLAPGDQIIKGLAKLLRAL